MVIVIVGHPAAGKDLAAEYLARKGFEHISSGDFIRELMKEKNIPTDRAHVHEFTKEMRAAHGNSFPAEEIIPRITGDAVLSGFRNLPSVDVVRRQFGDDFHLLAIDAPLRVRYERARGRQRTGDIISFEQFKEEEDRERNHESGSHEVEKVVAAADVIIENGGTKEDLFAKLDQFLDSVK